MILLVGLAAFQAPPPLPYDVTFFRSQRRYCPCAYTRGEYKRRSPVRFDRRSYHAVLPVHFSLLKFLFYSLFIQNIFDKTFFLKNDKFLGSSTLIRKICLFLFLFLHLASLTTTTIDSNTFSRVHLVQFTSRDPLFIM